MKVFSSASDRPAGLPETVVAMGSFDGVHIGHQKVIGDSVALARESGLAAAVLTFDPHPAVVLNPARAPKLIMTLAQRLAALEALRVEYVFAMPFSAGIAQLTPTEFVETFLAGALRARVVFVGDDFRFGHKRAGDVSTLRNLGLEVHPAHPVMWRGVRASSTAIRELVAVGKVNRAARLLGRPIALTGPVVRGQGIGAKQTVPTLNLAPENELTAADGVYVTRTTDPATNRCWRSVTNIGNRPTFGGVDRTVETFLLEPFTELPPERIDVEFLRYIRAERKFATPEELKAQIFRDVAVANRLHRRLARLVAA
jgi:riboflavin kinase/FMN adenylyltransferase